MRRQVAMCALSLLLALACGAVACSAKGGAHVGDGGGVSDAEAGVGDAAVTVPDVGGGGGGAGGGGVGGVGGGVGGVGGGLVAHWSFDEGSGNDVVDDRGGLVGRIVGGSTEDAADITGPPWVAGRNATSGTALDLDAAILGWIRVPDTGTLDRVASTNAITMAAWVRPRRLSIQGWDFIATRQVRGTTSEHFGFGFFMAVPACTINGMVAAPQPSMNPRFQWVHVAFTYDGTTCRVFQNGTQVASRAIGTPLQPDDTPLAIGANMDPPSPEDRTTENLGAIIDDVWLFDRALTPEEIAALAL